MSINQTVPVVVGRGLLHLPQDEERRRPRRNAGRKEGVGKEPAPGMQAGLRMAR